MSAYSDELRRLTGQKPIRKEPCPLCLRMLRVLEVKKENINKGRPFITCEDCDLFEWMDMPLCAACGRREYEATCKQGRNEGRTFRTCPGMCSFHWITKS